MDTATDSESAATTAAADASGDSMSGGTSPESTAHSPMSNCSLDKFMEALETLSPGANDHHQIHSGKRQILAGGIRRVSSGSVNSVSMDTSPPCAGIGDENSCRSGRGSLGEQSNASTSTTNPCSVISASSGWQTPRQRQFGAPVRCTSPGQKVAHGGRNSGSSSATISGGGVPVASGSLSRSPTSNKRKRSYAQLSSSPDDNGAPSPFPANGSSKDASRALSHSLLTVHQDGAYLQVTFDPSHRFVSEESPPEPMMSSQPQFQPDGPKEGRKDIDQALSLLQLSGGSSGSQVLNENMTPVSSEALDSGSDVALLSAAPSGPGGRNSSAANPDAISPRDFDRSWNLWPGPGGSLGDIASERQQGAAQSTANRLLRSDGSSPVECNKVFDENSASANGKTNGNSVADRGGISPRMGTRSSHAGAAAMAKSGETAASGKGQGRGAATKHEQQPEPKMIRAAKVKSRMRGPGGGQRPAVQAPVSTPQGKTGGGPGSFCSKPEALSQLDTSQSESMVLDADLWIVRERGDVCTSNECIYKDKTTGISSRRHYHATCDHRHKGGPKGGMIFHHHQLEKIQKHQRAHIRILHKKTPAEAVLSEANVEPYLPEAWSEEETKVLAHLVGIYGPTHWGTISAGVGTKSETQCMLHWRYSLNGNETVKGTGTWQPVEDERMLSLVQIFGQRWSTVAEHMPGRLAKQCRERYLNNLDPDLRRGAWAREEDEKLLQLRGQQNKSFAKIAEQIEGRSYNDVKNRWSQISRQIAALKRASSERGGAKATKTNPESSFPCGDGVGDEKDADGSLDVKSGSGVSLNKMPLQTATNISNANGNVSSSSSSSPSVSAMTTGTTSSSLAAAPPTVRYKICIEGGVPTLCEVGDTGSIETNPGLPVSVSAAACNVEPLPPASSLTGPTSSSVSSMVTSTGTGSPSAGGHLLPYMIGPPSSLVTAAVDMQQSGMGSEGLLRPLYSGSDASLSEAMGSLVGASSVGGAESVFGPPMTDAEAACIAAGPFMGFPNGGNDMRVSI